MTHRFLPFLICGLAAIAWTTPDASAQATPAAPAGAKKEKLVDVNKVNIEIQKTPDFPVPNVKQKRFIPKDWIEVEVDCKADISKAEKDPSKKTHQTVTFKYYLYFQGTPDSKKNRVVTGEVTHVNVPIKENIHSVMYLSPSALAKLTDHSPAINKTMVQQWGVAVFIDGQEVGRKTSKNDQEWWTTPGIAATENLLLDKTQTPFAPLWHDYHLEVGSK
jgi:hypothetical protein